MCGIVGGIVKENITQTLITGLKALEYRGYDSAGIAVVNDNGIVRVREVGKVANLIKKTNNVVGNIGIAHTRWATHGVVSQNNAHPHVCNNEVAVVHNGVIENFSKLTEQQKKLGYKFTSDTDSETITHAIFHELKKKITISSKRGC